MTGNSSETDRLLSGAAQGNQDQWGALLAQHRQWLRRKVALRMDRRLQGRIAALAPISDDELWGRFDPEQMEAEDIYPGIWDEDEEELRDEYLTYFRELKQVVAQAAEGEMGLLVTLS